MAARFRRRVYIDRRVLHYSQSVSNPLHNSLDLLEYVNGGNSPSVTLPTFRNGLTRNSALNDVVLGGPLDRSTVVSGGDYYNMGFLDINEFEVTAQNVSITSEYTTSLIQNTYTSNSANYSSIHNNLVDSSDPLISYNQYLELGNASNPADSFFNIIKMDTTNGNPYLSLNLKSTTVYNSTPAIVATSGLDVLRDTVIYNLPSHNEFLPSAINLVGSTTVGFTGSKNGNRYNAYTLYNDDTLISLAELETSDSSGSFIISTGGLLLNSKVSQLFSRFESSSLSIYPLPHEYGYIVNSDNGVGIYNSYNTSSSNLYYDYYFPVAPTISPNLVGKSIQFGPSISAFSRTTYGNNPSGQNALTLPKNGSFFTDNYKYYHTESKVIVGLDPLLTTIIDPSEEDIVITEVIVYYYYNGGVNLNCTVSVINSMYGRAGIIHQDTLPIMSVPSTVNEQQGWQSYTLRVSSPIVSGPNTLDSEIFVARGSLGAAPSTTVKAGDFITIFMGMSNIDEAVKFKVVLKGIPIRTII